VTLARGAAIGAALAGIQGAGWSVRVGSVARHPGEDTRLPALLLVLALCGGAGAAGGALYARLTRTGLGYYARWAAGGAAAYAVFLPGLLGLVALQPGTRAVVRVLLAPRAALGAPALLAGGAGAAALGVIYGWALRGRSRARAS
jgi:hypothetical protein